MRVAGVKPHVRACRELAARAKPLRSLPRWHWGLCVPSADHRRCLRQQREPGRGARMASETCREHSCGFTRRAGWRRRKGGKSGVRVGAGRKVLRVCFARAERVGAGTESPFLPPPPPHTPTHTHTSTVRGGGIKAPLFDAHAHHHLLSRTMLHTLATHNSVAHSRPPSTPWTVHSESLGAATSGRFDPRCGQSSASGTRAEPIEKSASGCQDSARILASTIDRLSSLCRASGRQRAAQG